MQSDAKKRGNISVLMDYAGRRKVLTYLSWALSGISALIALMPFVFIWFIIRDVINAGGDFSGATNIAFYGWMAVACAFASMLIYFGGLMCSHKVCKKLYSLFSSAFPFVPLLGAEKSVCW